MWLRCFVLAAISIGLAGCSASSSSMPYGKGPLTVEEWKKLPIERKYDPYTFNRLKEADPKLKSDRAWDQFMRTVIVPHRKKDIPDIKSKK